METFKQARDLLEWVRNFHRRMKEAYGEAADRTEEDRVAMMFRFLESHEASFEETIEQALSNNDDVLDTWIQYTPDKERLQVFSEYEPNPTMTVEDVSDGAQQMSDALTLFFNEAVERIKTRQAREVFEQLMEKQKSDRAKISEHLQSINRGV